MVDQGKTRINDDMLEAVCFSPTPSAARANIGGLRLPTLPAPEAGVIRSPPSKNSSKLQENGKIILGLLRDGKNTASVKHEPIMGILK